MQTTRKEHVDIPALRPGAKAVIETETFLRLVANAARWKKDAERWEKSSRDQDAEIVRLKGAMRAAQNNTGLY